MGFGYSHDLDRIKSKQTLDFHIQGFSTALSSSHTMRRLQLYSISYISLVIAHRTLIFKKIFCALAQTISFPYNGLFLTLSFLQALACYLLKDTFQQPLGKRMILSLCASIHRLFLHYGNLWSSICFLYQKMSYLSHLRSGSITYLTFMSSSLNPILIIC